LRGAFSGKILITQIGAYPTTAEPLCHGTNQVLTDMEALWLQVKDRNRPAA